MISYRANERSYRIVSTDLAHASRLYTAIIEYMHCFSCCEYKDLAGCAMISHRTNERSYRTNERSDRIVSTDLAHASRLYTAVIEYIHS